MKQLHNVRRTVRYNHTYISELLAGVRRTFGNPGVIKRWHFMVPVDQKIGPDEIWTINFYFTDPRDITIFNLKFPEKAYETDTV